MPLPFGHECVAEVMEVGEAVRGVRVGDVLAEAYRHVVPSLLENPRQSVLVTSGDARSIAIYTVLMAKALGAPEVVFVDERPGQRELALQVGADRVAASCRELRKRFDLVVDCCVSRKDLHQAIGCVRSAH